MCCSNNGCTDLTDGLIEAYYTSAGKPNKLPDLPLGGWTKVEANQLNMLLTEIEDLFKRSGRYTPVQYLFAERCLSGCLPYNVKQHCDRLRTIVAEANPDQDFFDIFGANT